MHVNLLIDPMATPFCPFRVQMPLHYGLGFPIAMACRLLMDSYDPLSLREKLLLREGHASVPRSPKRGRARMQSRCQVGLLAEQRVLRIPNEPHSYTRTRMIMLGHCSVIIQ